MKKNNSKHIVPPPGRGGRSLNSGSDACVHLSSVLFPPRLLSNNYPLPTSNTGALSPCAVLFVAI